MAFLFKDYCFETIAQVGDYVVAEVYDGGGIFIDHVVVSATDIDVYSAPATFAYTITPPDCSPLGYKPWIPAEWSDFIPLVGAMALVIFTAWGFKMGKIALKG